jgi:hypothetical protein
MRISPCGLFSKNVYGRTDQMTDTITLPREVIERAISALQNCYDVDSYPNDGSTQQDASLNELRTALERQDEVDLIGFLPSEEKRQQTVISQTELRAVLAQQAEQVPEGWDNCRAENQCRRWCGNSACVSHAAPKEIK